MKDQKTWVTLDTSKPIWDRFYTVAPLYVVGTKGPDGEADLAPKHLATPMSWDNYFGVVCSETHGTLKNIERDGVFTVSAPRPDQVVLTSLAASPRCDDGSKPVVDALPTVPGIEVDAPCLRDAYLILECRFSQFVKNLGRNTLIIGEVVAARVDEDVMTAHEVDAQEQLHKHPLLTYISPGRFATIDKTQAYPFPKGFSR